MTDTRTDKGAVEQVLFGVPSEKQELFLTAKGRYVAYGGARGGGKSWALRFKLTVLCLKRAGIRCLLIRRTFAELKENHINVLRMLIPASLAKYRESDKVFSFANGSILKLGYMDSESDVLQYQGQEYDVVALDEATQLTEYQFQTLKGCVRGANDFPKRMYLTCNPGGVGHAWVKRLFIDRDFRPDEKPEDYAFIQALLYDNKPLMEKDPEYEMQLRSLPDDIKTAWLYGKWDIFDGQYFKEFDRGIHVADPFVIPSHWRLYRAFDYGLDMLACLWIAVDERGNSYVYRELNEPGLIVSEAAAAIRAATPDGEKIYETYCPPDMWARQKDSGKSMAEIFVQCGIDIVAASSDRCQGWLQVKEALKIRQERDQVTGKERKVSALRIFSNCTSLIGHIPLLQFDAKNVNDVSVTPHDITHNTDALRYFCISRAHAAAPLHVCGNRFEEYKKRVLPGRKVRRKW